MRTLDVTIDRYGAMITGKAGMRRIRIIDAVPDLQLWLNMHPRDDAPNAPLWITPKGGALSYTQAHAICTKAGEAAEKNVLVG